MDMSEEQDEYSIEWSEESSLSILHGIMRFPSLAAYEAAFAPLRRRMDAGEATRINIVDVPFMNAAGIEALAHLAAFANAKSAPLKLIASGKIPWQRKLAVGLKTVGGKIEIELR